MAQKKILLVDADKKVHDTFASLLPSPKYHIIAAESCTKAKEIIAQKDVFEAAVIALDLPEPVKELVALTSKNKIPTIVLGSSDDEAFREDMIQYNIIDYLFKEKKEELSKIPPMIEQLEKNRHIKILIVEDSRTFRYFVSEMLRAHCFETLEAVNGYNALQILKENPDIRLIITDHEMPEMNGLEMLRNVRDTFSTQELPVIVISSIGQKAIVAKYLKNGANDYLHKPFEREEFFSRIYLTISHKESIDSVKEQKRLLTQLSEELEEKVKQRTRELQIAYDELEKYKMQLESRVTEEVEKNKKQTSHMLQQSRLAQMGEMISMIAHQWRQPLASISAIAGTLSIDVIMDEYKKEFFQERLTAINDLSQHLSNTIDDFRSFFKKTKERSMTDWNEIVMGSLNIIGPTLTTKNITVHTRLEEEKPFSTYPNELKQVLLNIIKNAEETLLENNVSDAQIWLSSSTDMERTSLRIEDNAGGIPEEIRPFIFDPYFSTKEKKDGTGLGLYMSKTIIEDHCSGHLNAYNTQNGAVFEIILTPQDR